MWSMCAQMCVVYAYTCARAGLFCSKVGRNAWTEEGGKERKRDVRRSFLKTFVSVCRTSDRKDLWLTYRIYNTIGISTDLMDTPECIDIGAATRITTRLGARRVGNFWFKHVEKFIGDPLRRRLIPAKDRYAAAQKSSATRASKRFCYSH